MGKALDGSELCDYCCEWVDGLRGKSPVTVRDAYPRMMRTVLKNRFHMGGKAAKAFIKDACNCNWSRLHETNMERSATAEAYVKELLDDVWYCSDRWSWDRVLRIQWVYQRILRRCEVTDG